MTNRKWIFVAVIGVVFLFAGYNLYSYFQQQAVIAAQEERQAEERRVERERVAAERDAAQQAEAAQREADLQAARSAEEAQRLSDAEAREAARRVEQERQAAADAASLERERAADAERLQGRIARAREIQTFEGIRSDTVEELNVLSPRYVTDHPEEFRDQVFSAANMGGRERSSVKVFYNNSNPLMLYAAVSHDLRLLQALIDVGLDVNSANEMGVTPLMFAAAYNSPEVVNFLLGQGADASAVSYVEDMNALHFAARYNPNPETAVALLDAGLPIEGITTTGATAALLAAADNRNMEVIERLALRGADLGVYDVGGQSALLIAETRLGASGDRFANINNTFVSISPEYVEQVLAAIRGQ